jgi:cytidyltransferase-like protein
MITVCASGYFDPLHVGHLEMLRKAKELGDRLIVIINNDEQAKMKKGKSFMNEKDRAMIVRNLKYVDDVIIAIDKDKSVNETLRLIKPDIFVNGGDRTFTSDAPEVILQKEWNLKLVDGLGNKIRSSSDFTGLKSK